MMSAVIQHPEWYPHLPEGWKMVRVKTAIESFNSGVWGDDPYGDDSSTPVIRSNELDESGNWRVTTPALRLLSSSEKKQARLREGDLLIVKSSGSPAHIGKTAVVTKEIEDLGSCFSNFTGRIRVLPQRTNSRFIWYFLNNSPGRDQLFYYGTTTTGLINLSSTSIGIGVFALPPLPEQLLIAAYLDASCAAIDAAVSAKRRQLETLDAFRKTTMHYAVTKGLNTAAVCRASDVGWFGDIPKHWRCEHLKRFTTRIQAGMTPPTDTPDYYFDGTIPWFAPGSYNGDIELHEPRKLINKLARSEGALRMFPAESVFLIGIGATIGKVGLVPSEASCNQQIIGIVCSHRMHSRYLTYQLKIYEDVIPGIASATTLPIFDQVKAGYLPTLQPPREEQEAICDYLDEKLAEVKRIVVGIEAQIETLNAYRKSLIHECVTGQRRITEKDLNRITAHA